MTSQALRIAFLVPTFPEISNTFVLNQITGLLDRGHDVDIFALARTSLDHVHPDVERYRLLDRMRHLSVPRPPLRRALDAASELFSPSTWHLAVMDSFDPRVHGRDALNLVRLYTTLSFLRSGPYDVLHCQFGNLGPPAERLVARGAVRAKLVTAFRGADVTTHVAAHPERFRDLFRNGDLFLPVSARFRDLIEAAGAPRERIAVHHSGVALDRFTFAPRRPREGRPRLLFVGRLTEKKGLDYALAALALLRARGYEADLDVIGEGPLSGHAQRRCRELGLSDRVRFLGKRVQDEVIAAMHEAHVLLAPSVTAANGDQEGIPNVVKEAMATGLPVLTTRHSGIPELVDHGVSGFLSPERDAAAIADHLAMLLDHPELWGEMGRAARRKVEAEFDIERLNDDLVDLYRAVVAARRPEAGPVRRQRSRDAPRSRGTVRQGSDDS